MVKLARNQTRSRSTLPTTSPAAGLRFHRSVPMLLALVFLPTFLVAVPATSVGAATGTYYLKGSGVPKAALSTSAPTSGSLPNYDPGADSDPGRKLDKSGAGWGENDSGKYQLWIAPHAQLEIDGPVTLTFWSAMKDFNDDKEGRVEAYLLDCNQGGNSCVLIDQASRTANPWSSSGSWVSNTIDFGSVSYSIASNRSLAVKVVVGADSGDDMWFAYDTSNFPSKLTLQTVAPTTTTTTTTTVPSTTTTTKPPLVTTTTSPSVAPPTTDASIVRTTTTTTSPAPSTTSTTVSVVALPNPGSGPPEDFGPRTDATGVVPSLRPGPLDSVAMGGVADPAMAAMGMAETSSGTSPSDASWAGRLIGGLELVIPRWAVGVVASPLLVFGFVIEALTDSGKAIMLPLVLLMGGLLWVVFENRVFTLASIRRREDEDT